MGWSEDEEMTKYITIAVLLVGIFGGLGLVILVIYLCKRCSLRKQRQQLKRELASAGEPQQMSILDPQISNLHSHTGSWEEVNSSKHKLQRQDNLAVAGESGSDDDIQTLVYPPNKEVNTREDLVDEENNSLAVDNQLDVTDLHDRLFPEKHYVDRETHAMGFPSPRSRRPSRIELHPSSARSHSTLMSSLDSSTITADNRSEITVIEVNDPNDRRSVAGSFEDTTPRLQAAAPFQLQPSNNSGKYLTAFRPVPQRRRSAQAERKPKIENQKNLRLIQSYDPSWNRSSSLLSDDPRKSFDYTTRYRPFEVDLLTEKDEFKQIHKQNSYASAAVNVPTRMDRRVSQSICRSPGMRANDEDSDVIKICQPCNYPQPQPAPSSTNNYPQRDERTSANASYKQLWDLRSTLEDQSLDDDTDLNDTDQQSLISELHDDTDMAQSVRSLRPHSPTIHIRNVPSTAEPSRSLTWNVVYTHCESESDHPSLSAQESVDSEAAARAENLLQPPDVNRRLMFQRLLNSRTSGNKEIRNSTDKSFDSFDTATTDGAPSSESSRLEAYTTSFESSTTNDSESHIYKRQTMVNHKHDSGYKSKENESPEQPNPIEIVSLDCTNPDSQISHQDDLNLPGRALIHKAKSTVCFAESSGRTASRRRKDFQNKQSAGEQLVTSFSSFELETDSYQQSEQYAEQSMPPRDNSSVFFRFLNPVRNRRKNQLKRRDYSVDERTDALFREFIRYDPSLDLTRPSFQNNSQRSMTDRTMHRRYSSYERSQCRRAYDTIETVLENQCSTNG